MAQVVQDRRARGARVAALAAAVQIAAAAPALAAASIGCNAANQGGMNLSVAAGGSAVHQVSLDRGETLTLNLATSGRAALEVVDAEGEARTLHSGRATLVLFVAPMSGAYDFRLDAVGAAPVSLAARCTSVAQADAERAVLARRKAFVSEREPDRTRIDRPRGELNPFGAMGTTTTADGTAPRDITASISLSEITAAMNPDKKSDPGILDFWFEGRHLNYDTVDANARDTDGNFMVMYFGSKYMLGPDIMLGALAQFDQTGERGGAKASGWMVGPYVSVKFGPGIIFDGRAAWGVANNLPKGVALDMAPADRGLLRGTLRGARQVGGWTVTPSVGLSYVEDTPETRAAYEAATPTGSGRLDMLPEVKRRFDLNSDTYVEPRVAAGGFLSFDNMSQIAPAGLGAQLPDLHWKAEAGVAVGVKDSVNLQATGGVESGGADAADTWSGRLQLNMPLGK